MTGKEAGAGTGSTITSADIGKPYLVLLIPLVFFILHHLFTAVSVRSENYSVVNPEDYVRYDSYLYLDIARKGYDLFPCWEKFSEYTKGSPEWCGNAGWMPLYPLLIRGLCETGIQEYTAAFLLSRLFLLLTFIYLFLLLRPLGWKSVFGGMAMASLFPSSVYYDAAFPVSLFLMLCLMAYYHWKMNHLIPATVAAFLLPLAYSTGFLLLAVWMIFATLLYRRGDKRFRTAFVMAASVAAGYTAFFIIQRISLGVWNGFFLVQGKYGHGFHNPLPHIAAMVKSVCISGLNHNWQSVQSLSLILITASLLYMYRKNEHDDVRFVLVYLGIYLVFPLVVGSGLLSLFRAESLLLPMVLLCARKPALTFALLPLFAWMLYGCTLDFFAWKIV